MATRSQKILQTTLRSLLPETFTMKVISLLVIVVVASVAANDHFGAMKGRFEGWKKCNPGYTGFTASQLAAGQKCQDMNIKDEDCYLACFRYETGIVKAGKWDHSVAVGQMAAMWGPGHQADAAKWYDITYKCVQTYEGKGNKWSQDYSGNCGSKDFEDLKTCIRSHRNCK